MSFLLILGSQAPAVSSARLERLAQGELQGVASRAARLWWDATGRTEANGWSFGPPGADNELPQAAARLRLEGERWRCERDALATLPLWRATGDGWTAWSPQAKWFAAVEGVSLELLSEAELLAPRSGPENFSPFRQLEREPAWTAASLGAAGARIEQSAVSPEVAKSSASEADLAADLASAIDAATAAVPARERWTSLLSGGLDSGVATSRLRERSRALPLALSAESALASERGSAQATALELGVELHGVHVDGDRLRASFEHVVWHNEVFDGLTAEILAQVDAILALAPAHDAPWQPVLTGYGADLLLGGMLAHAAYMQAVGAHSEADLLTRTRWTGEVAPFFAWRRGFALHNFYWHPELWRACLRIPLERNAQGHADKAVLRRLAAARGWLSPERAAAPKRAITDGLRAQDLLSQALGLGSGYQFEAKSRAAAEHWRRRLAAVDAS
ncbi:MAG: asparagine synthase C-terminal domain-containing protein [Planctomycetota bacterium]